MSLRSGTRVFTPGIACVVAVVCLVAAKPARAADFDGLFYGNNDYGSVGLLETPTARARPEGEFGVGVSVERPYRQVALFTQPLPWLELIGRYTDIGNRFSGSEHYKDKSADVKVRVLQEGKYWPAVALGVQDIGGTGLFSSEYAVGSYHYYDLDFSAGLAWGRLGSGGGISNPFAIFGNHFNRDRYTNSSSSVGVGGNFGYSVWLTGKTIGPFGGIEWNTPLKGLRLLVEYDGNNYQHEALANNLRQDAPVNFGLSYRGLSGVDFGVGLERGNMVTAHISIFTNFQTLLGPAKTSDPVPEAVPAAVRTASGDAGAQPPPTDAAQAPPASSGATPAPAQPPPASLEQRHEFVLELKEALARQGFTLMAVDYSRAEKKVTVWLTQDHYRNPAKATGRAGRVLAATVPAEVSEFTLVFVDRGAENFRAAVARRDFADAAVNNDLERAAASVILEGPSSGYGNAQYIDKSWLPRFSWDTGPAVRQSVGGPDVFYAGQLYWKLAGALQLTDHVDVTAAAGFNIINNFNQIKLQSNSTLPHVRSDIVKYLQQGKDGIINLESDYIWSPYPDWYHRMSLGIFEEMYGGVATELLYRPYGRSWAVAVDVNRVKQRDYDEMFDFLPYTVTTGHVSIYYKPGFYNLLFKLSAGQYLARDRGGTLDISRTFNSGVRFGVFATKTNVSAAQFGEGSFDKGFYISLPLDLFFARSTRREAGFTFRPLTRDGGQMVYDGPELYFLEKDGQPDDFARGAGELLN